MADLATIPDVESRWRPLRGPNEPVNCSTWLSDASAELRLKVRDVDARMVESEDYGDAVTATVAHAVVRMFRGRDPADPADFSKIFYFQSEIDALIDGGAAEGSQSFTITTGYGQDPGYRYAADDWSWVTG